MAFPVFDFLAKRAALGPDREALRELVTGEAVSYRQLDTRAGRAATLLADLGIGAGDRVAVLCRNRIAFFELLFACGRLGAILVPLNWRMPAAELAALLADCRPRVLFHGAEDAPVARALVDPAADPEAKQEAGERSGGLPRVDFDDASAAGYAARRKACEVHPGRGAWDADDVWYLIYTSGTTGLPKAVIQTVGMGLANYVNISQGMGLRADDTSLNFLPLFHTAGINLTTLPALIDGARTLILPGFEVDPIVDLLAAGDLDTFFGVPACYQALALHPAFPSLPVGEVRAWGCGGAPMPERLLETFVARGARVMNGMGMTETGPTLFLMDEASVSNRIGSVGLPQLLSAVRIVGPDGSEVPDGEAGELWFSGPGITPGYWERPEETARALADGWLRSGDLGRRDADGYYYIVGRLKDMYISGGENVYPAEVENVLAHHPDLLEAAVVGIPDERWGEVGRAYLLPREGHDRPDEAALTAWCRERLAPYKVPREYRYIDDFPRTAAGKVQKHLLEDQ